MSMISSESRTMSGLRRSSTPAIPIAKRIAEIARYQGTPGPSISRAPSCASARSSASERIPRTTPPTAATSSTIDVISNASRWSVRNSRPISAGEPNARLMSASSERRSPASSMIATSVTARSEAAVITDAAWNSRVPPAHGASARPPRYAITKRNMTITAPA